MRVDIGDPLISLSPEVVEDLSSYPFYACNIDGGIRSGIISNDLAMFEMGPTNQSRLRTTSNRIFRPRISKQTLKDKDYDHSKTIVEFIVGIYIPTWCLIRVKHHWMEGPRHVLY